jgi:flagellar motility protein MotE (MotC chaperone)
MKSVPRILPLVAVAIGGVLAVNALTGVRDLPQLLNGAKAYAEDAIKPKAKTAADKGSKAKPVAAKGEKAEPGGEGGAAAEAGAPADPSSYSIMNANQAGVPAAANAAPAPAVRSAAICAPTAAELAKEAGLSPAELRVLQSLGTRRGQLDQREKDMDLQLQLLAAAEAKLDAKIKTMNGLKGQIQSLISQADAQQQAENDRLIRIYEAMKPKDAASRLTLLDDSVRLPIASKMKERALSAVLAQMSPADAKTLTEKLANRFAAARAVNEARAAVTPANPGAAKPAAGKAAPGKTG